MLFRELLTFSRNESLGLFVALFRPEKKKKTIIYNVSISIILLLFSLIIIKIQVGISKLNGHWLTSSFCKVVLMSKRIVVIAIGFGHFYIYVKFKL